MSLNSFYKNIYTNREEIFNTMLDNNEIKVNITDLKKREIFDLSHGERSLFILTFLIYFKAFKRNRNLIIYLDEPDSTLHPQWQKEFVSQLINVFSDFKHTIHFIITSHSPFILSDIPKENVIFLENGVQKYPFKENEQTFGANIHTLLSHGFFMNDGLMGEFAKSKINEVIKLLKKEHLSKDEIKTCKQIISIIGEPILQKTLEHQLNEKINLTETELEKLEREQKQIKEKIDKLKSKNNETN